MEMVVSLFLIVLIISFAAVSMDSVSNESRLRHPSSELNGFAKRALKSAVAEQRSYSVYFYERYFLLRETYPEERIPEEGVALDLFKTPEEKAEEEEAMVTVVRHDLATEVGLEVRRWKSKEWIVPNGVEWVFEPSGLCEPLSVRFTRHDGYVEVDYNPLTAGVQDERLYIP